MDYCSDYDHSEHAHRFAAWAAGRAASTPTLRLKVGDCQKWVEAVPELRKCAGSIDELPNAESFDAAHRQWRGKLIKQAQNQAMTHGIAAKIINIYLKAAVSHWRDQDNPKVKAMHPPIDRLLLKALRDECPAIWQGQNLSWSTFDEEQYVDVINRVKRTVGTDEPLWKIERYWRGFS